MCYIIILHDQNICWAPLIPYTNKKNPLIFYFFFYDFFVCWVVLFFISFLHYSHQFLFSFVLCVRYVPGMRLSSVLRSTTAVWLFQSRVFSVVGRGLIGLGIPSTICTLFRRKYVQSVWTRDRIIEFKIIWGISN